MRPIKRVCVERDESKGKNLGNQIHVCIESSYDARERIVKEKKSLNLKVTQDLKRPERIRHGRNHGWEKFHKRGSMRIEEPGGPSVCRVLEG